MKRAFDLLMRKERIEEFKKIEKRIYELCEMVKRLSERIDNLQEQVDVLQREVDDGR